MIMKRGYDKIANNEIFVVFAVLMDWWAPTEGASGRCVTIGRNHVCQRLAWRQQDASLALGD